MPALVLAMAFVSKGLAQGEPLRSPAAPQEAKESVTSNTAIPRQPPSITPFSAWTTEVVKLADAGIEDGVVLSFIDNTPGTFNLDADQIIHLHGKGVSSQVITSMLEHDLDLVSGQRPVLASTVPSSQSTVKITFVPGSETSGDGGEQPSPAPVSRAVGNSSLLGTPHPESVTAVEHDGASSQSSDWTYTMTDEFQTRGSAVLVKPRPEPNGREYYPVREPYPVEITAPIIVIRASSRTPNTLLIDFSP